MRITESRLRRIIRNVIAETYSDYNDDVDLAIEELSRFVYEETEFGPAKPSPGARAQANKVFSLIGAPDSDYDEANLFHALCDDPENQPHRKDYLAKLGIFDLEESEEVDEDFKQDFETFQPRRY